MKEKQAGKDRQTLYLGQRKVSTMNFSSVVTLPKAFTENYLDKTRTVQMSMSPEGHLILTPVSGSNKDSGGEE